MCASLRADRKAHAGVDAYHLAMHGLLPIIARLNHPGFFFSVTASPVSRRSVTRRSRWLRSRAGVACLLLALASTWVQMAWHLPMALAQNGGQGIAGVNCGGPLAAADIARLVALGQLPADRADEGHGLCDLLTAPAAGTTVHLADFPFLAAGIAPAVLLAAVAPAAPQTRLPPARAPPVA